MRLRPDDLPETVAGEIRNVMFTIGGAMQGSTISGTPTVASINGLCSFDTPSVDGTTVTVATTFATAGRDQIKMTAILDSGEKLIGIVRSNTVDPSACGTDRYN